MNLATVDLNLLVAFEALMEERHVTRAAERIGLAQPSMSSALRRLRALFADEWFLRAGAGMQPTERALALAGPIGEALRQIRGALAPDRGFDPATARRRITIAATDYGDLVLVPELTRLLRMEAPGIDLAVRPLTDPTVALAKLERGELDAVIGGHRRQIGWVENLSSVAIDLGLILRRTVVKRIHVPRQLFQEPVSARQPATEILHEALEPLVPLDAGGLLGAVG